MPFSILVVQSQRWHVAECLDIPRDKCQECPDGLQCSSTIPNHFRKFNHTLLAHSRANSDTALLSLSEQAETSGESGLSCLPGLMNNEVDDSSLETSQDSAVSLSVSSPLSKNTGTPPSKLTNGLLFLRSPGPEDFKKKKGWSSSAKGHKSISASQESKTELSSTPVKEDCGGQACEGFPKSEPSPENDDIISYSPLSEFPAETEVNNMPSSQTSTVQRSQSMLPQKGQSKSGQASGLKQTDIGVFFGLKPLKEKEAKSGPNELNTTSVPALVENSGQRRQRRERQRRSKADTTTDTSQGTVTVDSRDVGNAQGKTRRGWRRSRWNRVNADGEVALPRCPFYKKIPGTKFVIDAFRYGEIEGITAYFLTHFHSDHYGGLTKNTTVPIYCNRITGNLVKSKLKVAEQYVHILPMNTPVTVEGVRVILLDANHCPGSAMLLFFLPDGQTVLHTGDFRADPSMETYPELLSCRVQTLYLDTTYCSPQYTFPRQQEVINFAASTAFELVTLNPRTLVVCGSYSVGKERVFLALAEVLGSKVCLSRDKYNTMCCLESEQVRQRITTDWKEAQVHVLPMMQLSFKKLQDHLARFSQRYDQLVAFKPTGWTFSQQVESVEDIQPEISGNISIYGIPYSEHSSFLELKRFVQWIQPLKIVPTVNNGSWASRKAMEKCFSEWLMETKAKL
ncbi:DNA cross-link repair 1A protein [Lates japonicus]|uniref:DNA cross-link repair 1A protein n=1 Tax=Lates japonicus TaxID=270547 RepID=A0AAD3N0P4_LATJO|nr:DNA cross-link repair 1A protein [Lates japonicus]